MFINDVTFTNMGSFENSIEKSRMTGVYPLFGFAVEDYLSDFELSIKDLKNRYIFACILTDKEINDDFFEFMNIVMEGGNGVAMVDIDITEVSDSNVDRIIKTIDGSHSFRELKGVYEDRIVFARL